jgi:hypothetical protein
VGSWTLHAEGHGIHDNGRQDDADAMFEKFIADLRAAGHVVNRASVTVGVRRSTHSASVEGDGSKLTVSE